MRRQGLEMEEHIMQELRERIRDAELVLVGLGEDFEYDWNALTSDGRYREIEAETGAGPEYVWITPFLQKMVLQRGERDAKWSGAYASLEKLLAGKNYFIVSLCMDDYIYDTGLEQSRIVTPCGGFRQMQCDMNCSDVLSEVPSDTCLEVAKYYNGELPVSALREPVCPVCGGKLRFNQLGVTRYAEKGYLAQWERYTKWLQGTVNKRLCVLELGVGMEYPTVIRFPFEKIVFYNQKAFLCRVHETLYQVGDSIGERSVGAAEEPVAWLRGMCL